MVVRAVFQLLKTLILSTVTSLYETKLYGKISALLLTLGMSRCAAVARQAGSQTVKPETERHLGSGWHLFPCRIRGWLGGENRTQGIGQGFRRLKVWDCVLPHSSVVPEAVDEPKHSYMKSDCLMAQDEDDACCAIHQKTYMRPFRHFVKFSREHGSIGVRDTKKVSIINHIVCVALVTFITTMEPRARCNSALRSLEPVKSGDKVPGP